MARRRKGWGRWRGAAALTALLASGCSLSNLQFVQDTRLHFISPRSRTLVHLPVTISWKMADFKVVGPGTAPVTNGTGYFAVFVDRAPVRPGQSLSAVADRSCRDTPGCVNAGYLADRGVYVSREDSVTLTEVASLNSYQTVQLHQAAVVLMSSGGRRMGESAWYLDFKLRVPGA